MRTFHLIFSLVFYSTICFAQSGYPDLTFRDHGQIVDHLGGTLDFLKTIELQDDQKILAAGFSNAGSTRDMAVVRYLSDGSRDSTFGTDGLVLIDFAQGSDACNAIVELNDGRILLAGDVQAGNDYDYGVTRLFSDGNIDSTFGINGKVITDIGGAYEIPYAMKVQQDDKIVIAGHSPGNGGDADFAMVRLYPDGKVDSTFGEAGIVKTNITRSDEARDLAILPNGRIILAGFTTSLGSDMADFAMIRYLSDGSMDKTFGVGGMAITDLEGFGRGDYANSMLIEADGKIVLGGAANFAPGAEGDLGMVRYKPDGERDSTFGVNGVFIHGLASNDKIESIARQSDGKYILSGVTNVLFSQDWLLARVNNNGTLDTSFGDEGLIVSSFAGDGDWASDVLIQKDSRIVQAGYNGDFTKLDFILERFIADLVVDVSLQDASCPGTTDGIIDLTVSGGSPPYEYSLDSGLTFQTSPIFGGLGAGIYSPMIVDAGGLFVVVGPYTITEPSGPFIIEVIVTGNTITIVAEGTGPFAYSLNGSPFGTSNIFTDLPDGTYQPAVLDFNGCVVSGDEVVINISGIQSFENSISLTLTPNPVKDFMKIHASEIQSIVNVEIINVNGRIIMHENMIADKAGNLFFDIRSVPAGLYILRISRNEKRGARLFSVIR